MEGEQQRGPAYFALAYGALLVALALAAAIGAAWHTGLVNLYLALGLSTWSYPAFAGAAAMALVVAWLIASVYFEHTLSSAGDVARLRRRATRLLGLEAGVLALSSLPLWLLGSSRLV